MAERNKAVEPKRVAELVGFDAFVVGGIVILVETVADIYIMVELGVASPAAR